MGANYRIECSKYPYTGIADETYQSNSLFKAFVFLIVAMFKYEIIDFHIRNHNRMSMMSEVKEYECTNC